MMSLVLYLVVLLVSLSSVLFGVGWLSAPEPHYQAPPAQVARQTVPAAPKAKGNANAGLSPVSPTVPASPLAAPAKAAAMSAPPPAAPNKPAAVSTPSPPAPQDAAKVDTASAGPAQTEAVAAPTPAPATPACDVQACAAAYYSFRASDCTYQPYNGPRRLCTKGKPPQTKAEPATDAAPSGSDARAQAPTCNVAACEAAYRTFTASDCTYQPIDGPRRLCTK